MSRIAILAGGGALPVLVAERAVAQGHAVHIIAIRGEADAGIERFPHTWIGWGSIGRLLATLASHRSEDLVIVGKVTRPDLAQVRPDLGLFLNLPHIIALLTGGDDALLTRVVRFFEQRGVRVRGAHELAPELVAGEGPLGAREPRDRDMADIAHGLALVRRLGPLDVGQAVVVARGRTIAAEAAEGTDRMLARCRELMAGGGSDADGRRGVLVKGPKPGQELRVDMPVVGPRTVELAAAAGLAGIALAAGGVMIAERPETLRAAEAAGLFLAGVPPPSSAAGLAAASDGAAWECATAGSGAALRRRFADLAKGRAVVLALRDLDAGRAAVVRRQYVLAVESGEGLAAMLTRCAGPQPWGRLMSWRTGVLAVAAPLLGRERAGLAAGQTAVDWPAVMARCRAARLSGIAVIGAGADPRQLAEVAELAAGAGLFLARERLGPGGGRPDAAGPDRAGARP